MYAIWKANCSPISISEVCFDITIPNVFNTSQGQSIQVPLLILPLQRMPKHARLAFIRFRVTCVHSPFFDRCWNRTGTAISIRMDRRRNFNLPKPTRFASPSACRVHGNSSQRKRLINHDSTPTTSAGFVPHSVTFRSSSRHLIIPSIIDRVQSSCGTVKPFSVCQTPH